MNKIIWLFKNGLFFALIIWIPLPVSSGFSSQEPSEEVFQAANTGLHPFLKKIRSASYLNFGFNKEDVLDDVSLGVPFKLYTITPTALNNALGKPIESIASETPMWYFPVILNGTIRTFLIIDRVGIKWEVVSLGQTNLAHEVDAIQQQWPNSKGYHPYYLVVYQAREYCFTIPKISADNLTSIEISSPMSLPKEKSVSEDKTGVSGKAKYSALGKADDLIVKLKNKVEHNLKSKY